MKNKAKVNLKIVMLTAVLFIIVFMFGILGMSYSYYKTKIEGSPDPLSGNLRKIVVEYNDTESVVGTEITPGWEYTKTFSVTNENNIITSYKLEFTNLINTFELGHLKYTVTSTDGGCSVSESSVPYIYTVPTSVAICPSVEINANTTHTYTIKFEYKEIEDMNYGPDQGKSFSSKITIGKEITLYNKILTDNTPQSDASINFDSIDGNGLFYTEDEETYGEDGERIYYFRGNVNNNWISFAGYLWRIVRTTSEGGVKLVYSGDGNATSSGFISSNATFNGNDNNKYYVGYTYNTGLDGYEGPQTYSNIKTIIDNWYSGANGIKEYEEYLSPTAVYCNDRSSETIEWEYLLYPAYDRIYTNYRPTYACPSTNASRYTVSTSTGNGYLQNPIALLTADEINYAGVSNTYESSNSYIMENARSSWWWTLSPSASDTNNPDADVLLVIQPGLLKGYGVTATSEVRPAVSLKSSVIYISGDGTKLNPYLIGN